MISLDKNNQIIKLEKNYMKKNDLEYLDSEKYVEFSDLALCSVLQYLDFPIVATNRDPKDFPKVKFVFRKSNKLDTTVDQYWSGELLVEPKGFWNVSRELKSRIRTA
jgi:hypothetical protein